MDNYNNKRQSYKGTKYYITNKELLTEIERCRPTREVSERLGEMIILLCERLCSKGNLRGYSFVDELCSNAQVACLESVFKFNPIGRKTPNPFAYLTAVAYNNIRATLNSETRVRTIRDELLIDKGFSPSSTYLEKYYENKNAQPIWQ